MTIAVFLVVLLAAVLHATWNAVVKSGRDKLLTTVLVTGSAALIAIIWLPFLSVPARPSWPFIAASTVLQISYFVLVAQTYRIADMSETYPLMRCTAPLLVAVASVTFLNEPLAPLAWLGVITICVGILGMAAGRRAGRGKGVSLAFLNAVVIAGYTLIDGSRVLERQREGIAKAQAEGKYKGRPANIDVAEIKRLAATMGPAAIAKSLGIARSSVYRLLEPDMVE